MIGLKFAVRLVIIILIRSMDKRKNCGYSMIAHLRTEVLKSLFSKWKEYIKTVARHNDVIPVS